MGICDLRGAHAALEDRLTRAELVLERQGSASKDCTPENEISIPEIAQRLRELEENVAASRRNISGCEEAVRFAVKDAQERDSAVASVRAAVEGLETVEALTSQHHKQIQDLANAFKSMRLTMASLTSHMDLAQESVTAPTPVGATSPPKGGPASRFISSGCLVGRPASNPNGGGVSPGRPTTRAPVACSQSVRAASLESLYQAREKECESGSAHAAAPSTQHSVGPGGYLNLACRTSPKGSARVDMSPPPVAGTARATSPPLPMSLRQASGPSHLMRQTFVGNHRSVRHS